MSTNTSWSQIIRKTFKVHYRMGDHAPLPDSGNVDHPLKSFSQSPWPAWGLATAFLATAPLSPNVHPHLPPFIHRVGFGIILTGAGYVVSQDKLNGSGIATAWSLSYLFFNLRSSIRHRSPIALGLSGATMSCVALYGSEYFLFQKKSEAEETKRRRPATTFSL